MKPRPKETLYVRFYDRASPTTQLDFDKLVVSVRIMGKESQLGESYADLQADGASEDILRLTDNVGCYVKIFNQYEVCRWVGIVEAVEPDGVLSGLSLKEMANRVCVVYSQINPENPMGGTSAQTAWDSQSESISTFGQADLKVSMGPAPEAEALTRRATTLAERAWPAPSYTLLPNLKSTTARVSCIGLGRTLNRRYYEQLSYGETLVSPGQLDYIFGGVYTDSKEVAQTISVPNGGVVAPLPYLIGKLSVKLGRYDNWAIDHDIVVKICKDNAGVPGTVLASWTFGAAGLPGYLEWKELNVSAPYLQLNYETTYWIWMAWTKAHPTGFGTPMTKVCTDNPYTTGRMHYRDSGGTWHNEDADYDIKFKLLAYVESTQQIANIVTAVGDRLAGTRLLVSSGVFNTPYRDGSRKADEEILQIMKTGTSSNRRLCARITEDRYLEVNVEPVKGAADYTFTSEGVLVDNLGNQVAPEECTCGVWVSLADLVPASVSLSRNISPTTVFIESAEYDYESGICTYTPKNVVSPFEIGLARSS